MRITLLDGMMYLMTFFPLLRRRLCEARRRTDDEVLMNEVERIKSVVARNVVTATREPDLYDGQDMPSQESAFLDICLGNAKLMQIIRF